MAEMRTLIIRGNFTDEEFAKIVAVVRKIDDERPNGHFEVLGIDPHSDMDTAEEIIRKALPPMSGRNTKWSRFDFEK